MFDEYWGALGKQILTEIFAQLKKFDEIMGLEVFKCAGSEYSFVVFCNNKFHMTC